MQKIEKLKKWIDDQLADPELKRLAGAEMGMSHAYDKVLEEIKYLYDQNCGNCHHHFNVGKLKFSKCHEGQPTCQDSDWCDKWKLIESGVLI